MKKLVTSAMALMAGLALATGVESANIVGYFDKELNEAGYTDACPVFWQVGSATGANTIGDVIPNANFACGEDTVEIYDEDGDSAYYLTYYSQAFITKYHMTCEPGWYDYYDYDTETCLNDVVELPFGSAFTCYTDSSDVALRFAGEVYQEDYPIPLNEAGYTDMGNASAVELTIGAFVPNANFACGEDTVEIYDEDGDSAYYLTYYSQAFITKYHMTCDPGWYDYYDYDTETCLNDDVTIAIGQGFTCYTDSADVAITIPSAL